MKKLINILIKKEALVMAGIPVIFTLIWALIDPSPESICTFLLFFFIFIAVGLIRRTNNNDIYYSSVKTNLDEIERHLIDLKPYTALDQLNSFKAHFNDQYLSETNKKRVTSRFNYLKGQCFLETSNIKNDAFELLINAYKLDDSVLEITERAITSFYQLGDENEAQLLSDRLLVEDPFNARAWVVQVLTKNKGSIDSVPANVLAKIDFRFILCSLLMKQQNISAVKNLIRIDLKNGFNQLEIDNLNFRYYLQLALFCYNDFFSRFTLFVDPDRNLDLFENPEVTKINVLLARIVERFKSSELFVKNPYYQQAFVFLNFTDFYTSRDKDAVFRNFEILKSGFEYVTDGIIKQLAINLAHINEYDKLITICHSTEYEHILDLKLVKAEYYLKNNKTEEALESYLSYLDAVESIDLRDAKLALAVIDILCKSSGNPLIFVEDLVKKKQFLNTYHVQLIKAYALRFYVDKSDEAYDSLQPILYRYADFDIDEKLTACSVLAAIHRYNECYSYLSSIVNIDVESPQLKFFIEILFRLKKDHEELLLYLGNWNDHYKVNLEFLSWEMQLKYIQGDMKRIEFLAQKGKSSYPNRSYFLTNLCNALYRQEKYDELRAIKSELKDYEIPYQSAFEMANIYFQIGENEFATELAFQQLKKHPNNVVVKQTYFTLLAFGKRNSHEIQSSVIEGDCTVRVQVGSEIKLIHINEETLNTNKISKAFLGKKIDEIIRYVEPLTGSILEYRIIQIMDKYTGMIAQISEDFKESTQIEGYNIISIETPNDDIEAFSKKLIETLGYEGEKRHLRIEDAFNKYELGVFSFTELVNHVDENNPISIYDHLTHFGRWCRIPSLEFVKNVDYSRIEEYVIDLTAIDALVALSNEIVKLEITFIVSSFLVEHLRQKVQELESQGDEQITLSVRMERVEPHITGKQEIEDRIVRYKGYLQWIEKFCSVEFSAKKLDVISESPNYNPNRWYFNYWLDTIFLANAAQRSLITNDEVNFKKFFKQTQPMTTEYFFLSKGLSQESVSSYHLHNKYVGVKINTVILIKAFESTKIYEKNQIFKNCINALNFNIHGDKNVIFEVVTFLKYLYASEQNNIFKNSIAETLIFETLKSYPIDPPFSEKFKSCILNEFQFLPLQQIELMKVVIKVFDIYNLNK